jgi:hypothetical protein
VDCRLRLGAGFQLRLAVASLQHRVVDSQLLPAAGFQQHQEVDFQLRLGADAQLRLVVAFQQRRVVGAQLHRGKTLTLGIVLTPIARSLVA